MIDTLFLANKIQEVLCQNNYGIDFLVFNDVGDLVKSKRTGLKIEKYIQGILENVSSSVVPIKNISFKVLNTQLCLFVDINELGTFTTEGNREQSKNVEVVKEILQETLYQLNGKTIIMSDGEKEFNVTIAMSDATTGDKTSLGEINELLPLYIDISFTIFENGVNTNEIKLLLNGEEIYFTGLTVNKVKTPDQSVFADDKQSKIYMLMGGKSIDLTIPVVNTKMGKVIYEDIMGNTLNKAISVILQSPFGDYGFIGVLGNTTLTGENGKNLGYNVSIVEGKQSILKYDDDWEIKIHTIGTAKYVKSNKGVSIIHWGDDTYTIAKNIGTYTHEYNDDTLTLHTIRIYKG